MVVKSALAKSVIRYFLLFRKMRTLLKIYAPFLFLVLAGNMFHVAYLGASKEHEMKPGPLESFYLFSMFAWMCLIIWSIALIRKKDMPFLRTQAASLILLSITLIIILYLKNV
jgi:hypothetical protein